MPFIEDYIITLAMTITKTECKLIYSEGIRRRYQQQVWISRAQGLTRIMKKFRMGHLRDTIDDELMPSDYQTEVDDVVKNDCPSF